jgi:hypothetical protein
MLTSVAYKPGHAPATQQQFVSVCLPHTIFTLYAKRPCPSAAADSSRNFSRSGNVSLSSLEPLLTSVKGLWDGRAEPRRVAYIRRSCVSPVHTGRLPKRLSPPRIASAGNARQRVLIRFQNEQESVSLAHKRDIAAQREAREACGTCACRKLNPGILMMQSVQGWATRKCAARSTACETSASFPAAGFRDLICDPTAVGCAVTPNHKICRRRCPTSRRNETNRSIAAMP